MRHPTLVVNVLLVKVTNPFPRAVHRPGDPRRKTMQIVCMGRVLHHPPTSGGGFQLLV